MNQHGLTSLKRTIIHIIPNLDRGGAEKNVVSLVQQTNDEYECIIIVLQNRTDKWYELGDKSVATIYIPESRFGVLRLLFALNNLRKIINEKCDPIICGWMYHGNLIASFGKIFQRQCTIVWNIRRGTVALRELGINSYLSMLVGKYLSRSIPRYILYNSKKGLLAHLEVGYNKQNAKVIDNIPGSFHLQYKDTDIDYVVKKYGLLPQYHVVLSVGRNITTKRFPDVIEIAKQVLSKTKSVKFIILGNGVTRDKTLLNKIKAYELIDSVILIEKSTIIGAFYARSTCLLVTSESEGTSNVVQEAVGFGLPCVLNSACQLDEAHPNVFYYNQGWLDEASEFILSILEKNLSVFSMCRTMLTTGKVEKSDEALTFMNIVTGQNG